MSAVRRLRPVFAPAVQRQLRSRFDGASIHAILEDALADYEAQLPDILQENTIGGRIMVHLAALTIGLYRALVARGTSAADARDLTAGVTSQVYGKLAIAPTLISRIGSGTSRDRLKRATDVFRRFPFSAPSYQMADRAGGDGVVAFDVRRCPVAEYFRSQDLGDLCVESWCHLDFALAERWGARLERTTTIAGGATHCDFRWRVRDEGQPSSKCAPVLADKECDS